MNVGTINGVGAATSLKTDPRAGDDSARSAVAARKPTPATPAEIDDVTQQPLPPRFPWLSRLSQQLESRVEAACGVSARTDARRQPRQDGLAPLGHIAQLRSH